MRVPAEPPRRTRVPAPFPSDGAVADLVLVHSFPFVFNVADVAISPGAVVLAARLVRDTPADSTPSTAL